VIRPFTLKSAYNRISAVMVFPDAGAGPFPCTILSHGLISSKMSSKYVSLSERYAAMGIASCRFDYHGCGESGGDISETTLTIRLDNLDRIVESIRSMKEIDPERIGILGSSFGGVTCILKAAGDPRIKCVSPWATPHVLAKSDSGDVDGIIFKDSLYDDFARYDILSEAAKVSHALVIHGDADEVVPCHEGIAIYDRLQQPKTLEVIKGADHILSDPGHRERAISLALEWFDKYL
jgi:uncharacterized protein